MITFSLIRDFPVRDFFHLKTRKLEKKVVGHLSKTSKCCPFFRTFFLRPLIWARWRYSTREKQFKISYQLKMRSKWTWERIDEWERVEKKRERGTRASKIKRPKERLRWRWRECKNVMIFNSSARIPYGERVNGRFDNIISPLLTFAPLRPAHSFGFPQFLGRRLTTCCFRNQAVRETRANGN